jgi:hypothetical protein
LPATPYDGLTAKHDIARTGAARAGAAFFGDGRAYTPPLAGAVTWNVARRPPQPGHVSGFMPTTRASPPRAGDRPCSGLISLNGSPAW